MQQLNRKCYMVYIELSLLLRQAVTAKINKVQKNYMVSSGNTVEYDRKKNKAIIRFLDLEFSQTLDKTIDELLETTASTIERLEVAIEQD